MWPRAAVVVCGGWHSRNVRAHTPRTHLSTDGDDDEEEEEGAVAGKKCVHEGGWRVLANRKTRNILVHINR